jgi:hypothetical protein
MHTCSPGVAFRLFHNQGLSSDAKGCIRLQQTRLKRRSYDGVSCQCKRIQFKEVGNRTLIADRYFLQKYDYC